MDTIEAQKTLENYLDDSSNLNYLDLPTAVKIALIILIAFNNTLKEVSK